MGTATKALQTIRDEFAESVLGQELLRLGFRPAYWDFATNAIYPASEGVPDEAVAIRSPCGRVLATKATLIQGFERKGYFFTRAATASAVAQWGVLDDALPLEDDY